MSVRTMRSIGYVVVAAAGVSMTPLATLAHADVSACARPDAAKISRFANGPAADEAGSAEGYRWWTDVFATRRLPSRHVQMQPVAAIQQGDDTSASLAEVSPTLGELYRSTRDSITSATRGIPGLTTLWHIGRILVTGAPMQSETSTDGDEPERGTVK